MGLKRKSSGNMHDIFAGMVFFMVDRGVQSRRFQIWKRKLIQMGAVVEERLSKSVTYVLAMSAEALSEKVRTDPRKYFGKRFLSYQWLEDSLKSGEKVAEDAYQLEIDCEGQRSLKKVSDRGSNLDSGALDIRDSSFLSHARSSSAESPGSHNENLSLLYKPPDLNKNITGIFAKLIEIYRAIGDDRRSFSYYKAIPVIEKLPFRIERTDQVKDLPGIGKSLQNHIQEIVTTGKLLKLEHFEKDEKVRTITLFGEVWGIGPATALKLYDKGYRTLDDLKNDDSLTHAQKIGLKYFNDIKARIPRNEVQEMEQLLQKVGEEMLPGVLIVCGGSYRRGKASCGDLDIVITHPDGKSHKGFLASYVGYLKDIKFLREDLVFSTHSEKGTDSGVDTYFGLCTCPGKELRHRIDFKVYPRAIYAFGLIAWTGNDVLNRRLRLLAESKGLRLDDTGLFPAVPSSGGKKGARGSASLKLDTEKEVFCFLGYPWLEPIERNL